jgi:hypothetical protein
MKKFKSLMLAALASAALAAPSFAEGHSGGLAMTGEIVLGMKYTTSTPDGGTSSTVQDTYIGDVNAKLTGTVSDTASYAFEFQKDDEAAADAGLNFEMKGTASSGDNSIEAFAEITDITEGPAGQGYGDVYIKGSNKTLSVTVGKFGQTENYANGMGYYRAATNFGGNTVPYIEHITISGFEGLGVGVNAGDISITAEVPWMQVAGGTAAAPGHAYSLTKEGSTDTVATNVTGFRPNLKAKLGSANISATVYALSFSPVESGTETVSKSDTGIQLMGNVAAGAATVGLGYTQKNTKEGDADEVSPSILNGYVKVGLGSASNVGASFEVIGDGASKDETTVTRISASYDMPFFVEAVTLKLGVGTSTANTDKAAGSGSASGLEAEWSYAF